MRRGYVPRRGDIIWLSFTPQRGHEQAGRPFYGQPAPGCSGKYHA
jgi:hypothetical protein